MRIFLLGSLVLVTIFLDTVQAGGADGRVIEGLPSNRPLNIAHRGSSGMRPEHTVAAYQLAVDQGADIIECDLAVTKDKQLICTHDAWLNKTTDVHTKPEFQDRVKRYRIDGRFIEDYFTVDFTMEELKTLRTVQSRSYRDQSYNYQFPMASFDDYIAVAKNASAFGRTIGIYPETKNPSFFNGILEAENTTMEDILLASLEKYGYVNANSPCLIQSFDENSLRYMANKTELPLIILNPLLLTDQKMTELAVFCYGIGPSKSEILPVNPTSNKLLQSTDFITRAHAKGFKIHPYTFRNEDQFLAFDYGSDPYEEYQTFVNLGVDGLFTDFPHSFSKFLDCQYPQVVGNAAKLSMHLGTTVVITLLALFLQG